MKIYIKIFFKLFICLSLLIGTQANTQAVPVARYGVNAWLSAETIAASTARRAAMNDARYWPATAANDAAFKVAQANTISTMEKVAKAEAANAATFTLAATDVIQMAGLATMSVVGAPAWLTLLVTAGVVGMDIDNYFTMKQTLANNVNSPRVDYRPVQTPAGVRMRKTISGSTIISQTGVITQWYSKVVSAGGVVISTSNCPSTHACASLPQQSNVDLIGWIYSTNVTTLVPGSAATYTYYVNDPYAVAYFKNYTDIVNYLMSVPPCSLNSISIHPDYASQFGDFTAGPVCSFSKITSINSSYTVFQESIEVTRLKFNRPNGYESPFYFDVGNSTPTYQQSNYYTELENMAIAFGQSITVSALDAYGENAGKISLGQSELNAFASPESMAGLLNKLWLKASQQPDYRGLPYSPTNPVTVPQLSPQALPTLNALLQEVLNPQGEVVLSADGINPDPIVADNPDTEDPAFCTKNPTHSTCTNKEIDLKAPPATEPVLETTPTALAILRPLMNLIAPYSSFSVARPSTQCPTSSFDALGREWVLDVHCGLFESIRDLLSAVMLTVFAVASFRIVMRA